METLKRPVGRPPLPPELRKPKVDKGPVGRPPLSEEDKKLNELKKSLYAVFDKLIREAGDEFNNKYGAINTEWLGYLAARDIEALSDFLKRRPWYVSPWNKPSRGPMPIVDWAAAHRGEISIEEVRRQ